MYLAVTNINLRDAVDGDPSISVKKMGENTAEELERVIRENFYGVKNLKIFGGNGFTLNATFVTVDPTVEEDEDPLVLRWFTEVFSV